MGVIYLVTAVLLWSAIPLLIKQVTPPFDTRWVALLRLTLGATFLAAAERVIGWRARGPRVRARWRRREWVLLFLGGISLGGDYLLYTLGIRHTTASAGNLVIQIELIALAMWGLLILREKATPAKLGGMALAFSGVFLVAWNGQSLDALLRSQYFMGNLAVAAGGLCWSFYALSQKVLLRTRPAAEAVVPIMVIAAGVAAGAAAFARPCARAPTGVEWTYLVTLGCFGTGLSYLLMVRGLRVLEASRAALICTLLPVFTMTEAHFLLGEKLTAFMGGSAALIVAGVGLMMVGGEGAPAASG